MMNAIAELQQWRFTILGSLSNVGVEKIKYLKIPVSGRKQQHRFFQVRSGTE